MNYFHLGSLTYAKFVQGYVDVAVATMGVSSCELLSLGHFYLRKVAQSYVAVARTVRWG